MDSLMPLGIADRRVRLVDHEDVPAAGSDGRKNLRPLDVIDRGNRDRRRVPGVDVERQRSRELSQSARVGHGRLDGKSFSQLGGPLIAKPGGRQDEYAAGTTPREEFREHEARLNRLAEPHFVCQQHTRPKAVKHRHRRLQLVREQIKSGAGRRQERPGRRI